MLPLVLGVALAGISGPVSEPPGEDGYRRSLLRVEEAIRRRPGDPRLLLVLGDLHERAGRLPEALLVFEKVRAMSPRPPEAVLRAAQIRARLGEKEAAVPLFQAAIREGERPLRIAARAGLSDLLYLENRYGEAAAVLRESMADGDLSAEAHFLLGKALDREAAGVGPAESERRRKLEEEARAALEEAIRLEPGRAPAHYVLGMLLQRQGKSGEARSRLLAFQKAKAAQTASEVGEERRRERLDELRTVLDLARARLEAGSPREASEAVEEALRLSPGEVEARLLKAQVLLRAGQLDGAARLYEELVRERAADPEPLWNLARLRLRAGLKEEGALLALRAAQSRRFFPEAYELLAALALEENVLPERAEEFARRALEQRGSPANFVRLAIALHAAGKLAECEGVVKEGLARYPGDPQLQVGIAALKEGGPRKP
jgi:tetratricopeptide (TPR) repeat protein